MKSKTLIPRLTIVAVVLLAFMSACDKEKNTWDEYADWRHFNQKWLKEMADKTDEDGTPYYKTVVAPWDPEAFVLIHVFPSDSDNTGNLKPLYTSTTKVNYSVYLANDSLVDRAAGYQSVLNSSGLINGWSLAIMQLNVGDSAEFIMPYNVAYGENGYGLVPPYSDLRYGIRLVDIPYYEIKP